MPAAALIPVSEEQVKNLAALDHWLEHGGPHYVRNAMVGAAAGGLYGYYKVGKRDQSRALRYASLGVLATAVGGFALFQIGKWASKKEHEVLASAKVPGATPTVPVVTQGAFAGAPRALYPTVDAHHAYR